jgi:hypothetical protein
MAPDSIAVLEQAAYDKDDIGIDESRLWTKSIREPKLGSGTQETTSLFPDDSAYAAVGIDEFLKESIVKTPLIRPYDNTSSRFI